MRGLAKRNLIIAAVVLVLAAFIATGFCLYNIFRSIRVEYAYSSEAMGNPLMGYAPSAWHETVNDDVTLLYVDITWRELEPEEGVYDWEQIESENQFSRWRAEGKHVVLRFVCDIPSDEEHMDIPDWLYEKLDGDGTKYDTSYGYGFSPNYNNEEFIACHQRAVAALGERYGDDTLISYVELGSLGHWGEWHVKYSAGIDRIPMQDVRMQYVKHWVDAFPNAKLLMRRPFAEAAEYGLGIYNDMAGHAEDTEEWLSWISNGGTYDQTGEENAMVAMPDCWMTAPIGGELTSSIEMEQMLVSDLTQTVDLIRDSHTTFLGPKIADAQFADGYDAVLMNMGYRLWISDMKLSNILTGGIKVELTWQNSGVAPMYADWPVHLQVVDDEQNVIEAVDVDIALSELLPGEEVKTETRLSHIRSLNELDQYSLRLSIVDPMTGQSAVRFAVQNAAQFGNELVLWEPQ